MRIVQISDLHFGHAFANSGHGSCTLVSERKRQLGRFRKTAAKVNIDKVHAGRGNLHDGLVFSRTRHRDIFMFQNAGITILVDADRFHLLSPFKRIV